MGFVNGLLKVVAGSATGVAAVVASPLFGVVGTITAAGIVFGSVVGAAAAVADEVSESK